jgi:hypothetical protein
MRLNELRKCFQKLFRGGISLQSSRKTISITDRMKMGRHTLTRELLWARRMKRAKHQMKFLLLLRKSIEDEIY